MKISISTEPLSSRFSMEKVLRMAADAGFEAVDLGLFSRADAEWLAADSYLRRAEEIKREAEAARIVVGQIHAPFPSYFEADRERTAHACSCILRSLEVATELQCPHVIVHPATVACNSPLFSDAAAMRAINLAVYEAILPRAEALGVGIALENLFGYDDVRGEIVPCYASEVSALKEIARTLGGRTSVCLDVGHSAVTNRDPAAQTAQLGPLLSTLHIQTNDAVSDLHTLPFLYPSTDWEALREALRACNYAGTFNLEVFGFFRHIPDEMIPAALSFAAQTARAARDGTP